MGVSATVERRSLTPGAVSATVVGDVSLCKQKLNISYFSIIYICLFLFFSLSPPWLCLAVNISRGVVIAFVASPVLLMTTAASLGLAGGIEKVCEDLEAPEYTLFKEVVDDPNVWGGVTLVGLVTRELTNTVVNISIHQSLRYVYTP